jgi:hypothetical protein
VLGATSFRRALPAFRVRSGVTRAPGTGFRSRTPRGLAAVTVAVLLLANLILVYRLGDEDIPASVISPGGTRGVMDNGQPFAANPGDALEDIQASIMADIQAVSKPVIEEAPERRGPQRDRPSVEENGHGASATTTTSTGTAASSSSTSSSSSGSGSTTVSDTSDPAGGGSNGDADGTTDDTGASGGGAGGGGGTNSGDAGGGGSSGAGGAGGG